MSTRKRTKQIAFAAVLVFGSLVVIAFGAVVSRAAQMRRQAGETPMEWFQRMDANKDGKLSRAEAPSPRFKEIDADSDGFITLAEWTSFLNKEGLKRLDKDGDGKISQPEFNALYQDAEEFFRTRRQQAQPADGQTLPNPLPVKKDPLGLTFTQDFKPGTKDPEGRVLMGTEANRLVSHGGKLFASFGGGAKNPTRPEPDFRGYAVYRKESSTGPWIVDLDVGPTPFRIECMESIRFETDGNGVKLNPPISKLIASQWAPRRMFRVRDDEEGSWTLSPVGAGDQLTPGQVFTARALKGHRDKITGISHVFAGAWTGSRGAVGEYDAFILRGVYDPAAPGDIRWSEEPELKGVGRIMAFAVANGDLYAAACIRNDSPQSGGIFRRIDGKAPRWELVYRWKEYDLTVWDDEQRMMRGLTAVPDPSRPGKEVLIGFRYFPTPIIERIDPQNGHKASVELDLRPYFGRAFFGSGRYVGPIRAAYNPFTEVKLAGGRIVHLAGVQIYHPGFPKAPFNGSHYLVRSQDGSYDWGMVFDSKSPVPEGASLDGTRKIIVSPFPSDKSRVLYFSGYDGPFANNRSAWIYRASLGGGQ